MNYIKKFLDLTKITTVVSLTYCPLQGTTGVCCTINFNLSNYFNIIGEFLKNDVKGSLNTLKKYTSFTNNLHIAELTKWNKLFDKANKQIVEAAKTAVDQFGTVLTNKHQFLYATATLCAPM